MIRNKCEQLYGTSITKIIKQEPQATEKIQVPRLIRNSTLELKTETNKSQSVVSKVTVESTTRLKEPTTNLTMQEIV